MTTAASPAPPGFVARPTPRGTLYVAAPAEADLCARGLDAWEGWRRALEGAPASTGRGGTVVLGGWRLKAMRRGGWLAALWRDRYPSGRRLVRTLAASVEAASRGVPTAKPVALIVEAGPGSFARGAMAVEEIEGVEDLARIVGRGAATRAGLESALSAIRGMHDRGVDHPDLNLGNVLLRPRPESGDDAFVIDFDRATLSAGPLPFSARQAALRRLERSCAKLTGSAGPLGPGSENLWYELYAAGDADLARRFASGRAVGRLTLALHRVGWRRH